MQQVKIITQDGKSITIDVSCYPNTMFETAVHFNYCKGNIDIEMKVEYSFEVMEIILSVIRGETKLHNHILEDVPYIEIVREFYHDYEPSDDYEWSDTEDEYEYDDPLEIVKKRGPNYQSKKEDHGDEECNEPTVD